MKTKFTSLFALMIALNGIFFAASASVVITSVSTPPTCYGGNNGTINITVTGGTLPYTYSWSNGATIEDLSGLSTGFYTVTVHDALNASGFKQCHVTTGVKIIGNIVASSVCFGNCNGSLNLTITNGNAPFQFLWNTGATTEDISGLCAGTYGVDVTDVNGCPKLIISQIIANPAITISSANVNPTCNGLCNGSINLTVTGGTAPFTYLWNNGSTTSSLTGLCDGPYCVTVTDAQQCTKSKCVLLTQPNGLNLTFVKQPVSCNGVADGSIDITPTGGTAPFTFVWSNGATSEDVSGLTAGNYCVTITDANGCSYPRCFVLIQPAIFAANASNTNATCHGYCNGTASVTATGGNLPYSYNWSNGSTGSAISNLCPGQYCVTVSDAHLCSVPICVTVTQPDSFYVTFVKHGVSCNGGNDGSLDITVVGGTSPFSFIWSNGATTEDISNLIQSGYYLTITDANGCIFSRSFAILQPAALSGGTSHTNVICNGACNGTATVNISGGTIPYSYLWDNGNTGTTATGLCAGQYCVTVSDAHQCSVIKCATITCTPSANNKSESTQSLSLNTTNNANLNITSYPNPVNAQTTIEFVANEDLTGVLEVYNAIGVKVALIYSGKIKEDQQYSFNYNFESLADGMYFARLTTNNGTAIQSIVKIR